MSHNTPDLTDCARAAPHTPHHHPSTTTTALFDFFQLCYVELCKKTGGDGMVCYVIRNFFSADKNNF